MHPVKVPDDQSCVCEEDEGPSDGCKQVPLLGTQRGLLMKLRSGTDNEGKGMVRPPLGLWYLHQGHTGALEPLSHTLKEGRDAAKIREKSWTAATMTASPNRIISKKHRLRDRGERETEKDGGGKRERKRERERGNWSPDHPCAYALPRGPSPQRPGG